MDVYAEARADPGTGGKRVNEGGGLEADEEEEMDETEQLKAQ